MTDQEVLQHYIQLVPFLADALGSGCEVVVHDTSTPDHSVLAIANSLTGRKPGDPMTDLALEMAHTHSYNDRDHISGYAAQGEGKQFYCSTFFIKNGERLVGMLCINRDLTAVRSAQLAFENLRQQFNLIEPRRTDVSETLSSLPLEELMKQRIANTIASNGLSPERMSVAEKMRIAQILEEEGVLNVKGAVAEIARQLGVSTPTVYRYLNKSRED